MFVRYEFSSSVNFILCLLKSYSIRPFFPPTQMDECGDLAEFDASPLNLSLINFSFKVSIFVLKTKQCSHYRYIQYCTSSLFS
jgi:hypothetical protein